MSKTLEDYLQEVTSKDTKTVLEALQRLAGYADVRAVTAIQNAFFHPSFVVRASAAFLSSVRMDAMLFDALLSLLDDEYPEVRLTTVVTLGKYAQKGIHPDVVVEELLKRQPEPQTALEVKDILIKAGNPIIPLLEMELVSLDENRRQRALEILPEMGDLGIMTLVEHIPQLQGRGRRQIALKLGSLNHPMLEDYFFQMMQSDKVEERRFAMAAISNSATNQKALQVCVHALLNDPDQDVRMDAAYYLAWSKLPAMRTYFDKYDASAEKGTTGRWIREIVQDGYFLLKLQELTLEQVHEMLFSGTKYERVMVTAELSRRSDPHSIPYLIRSLMVEKDARAQGHILVSLEDLEAQEAVDDILNFLTNAKSTQEQSLAYQVLGELGHPKALPTLMEVARTSLFDNISPFIKPVQAARQAIHTLKQRMGFLLQAWYQLDEDENEQRMMIAMTLAMRGDKRGIDLMMEHFELTPYPALRYHILRGLGISGSVLLLPFLLQQLVKPDAHLVWFTVLAIGQLGLTKAPPELSALLLDENPELRSVVLFTLGRIKDPETLPLILRRIEDAHPQVRALAVQTLHSFKATADWMPWLEKAAQDNSVWVRLEAARVIKKSNFNLAADTLKQMLVDAHEDVRMAGLNDAQYQLSEDLREALQACAAIKGGYAPRKARELLDNLDYRKDPDAYAARKKQEEKLKKQKEKEKQERKLRREVAPVLTQLRRQGWESVFITYVAGTAHVDWMTHYEDIEVGRILPLVREPNNAVDKKAIMVMDGQGNKLGYVPQFRNSHLARNMDEGFEAVGVVLDLNTRGRLPQMTLEIFKKRDENG